MSIRKLACAAFLASLFATTLGRHAVAADGFAVNRFEPSERGSQWFVLESLDMRGHLRPAVGVVLDYAHRPLAIYEPNGDVRAAIVKDMFTTHVGGSFVLWQRLRLAASMPFVLYTAGETGNALGVTYAPPKDSTAVGDLRFGADVRLFGQHDGPVTAAIGGRLWVPTGSTASYAGDGAVRGGPRVLAAGVIGVVAYSAQLGVMFRNAKEFPDKSVGNKLVYSAAGGYRTLDGNLVVGPELYGTTTLETAFKTRSSPLEILLGAHATVASSFRIGGGLGTGLTGGYGSPGVRALLSLEWAPEPFVAGPVVEPLPTVTDTDGDGIPDNEDACLDVQGARTNDPKTNGCADRDGDGILDPLDHCPFEAGPPNSDPERNGCPDKDSDGDGVIDREDKCPDVFGDKKLQGCPSDAQKDRDQDGVSDADDACPDDAGQPDPDPKKNGCPKAFASGSVVKLAQPLRFTGATATLDPAKDNEEILLAVSHMLINHPEMKLRIEAHTDNRGVVKTLKTLSEKRAAAVVDWLVAHGIDKSRLTGVGFGIERPIDSNDTEEGRKANQRVELIVEK